MLSQREDNNPCEWHKLSSQTMTWRMINRRLNVEISWNKVDAYFRGYLCTHENSGNFYTTKIPTLTVATVPNGLGMKLCVTHCTGQAEDRPSNAAGQTARNQPPGTSTPASILAAGEHMYMS